MIQQIDRRDLYNGSVLGLALGDALGVASQGLQPGAFETVTEPRGGGAYSLEPGEWTDETAMAMCLAEGLLHKNGLDIEDYRDRMRMWYQEGYWSSRDFCFGSLVRPFSRL